jgi:uncharacterized membrane protein
MPNTKLGAILSNIFGGADTIAALGDAVDKVTTTKEEKEKLKNELQKILNDTQIKATDAITERWVADSKSESWLTRSIRPLFLIWVIVNFTFIVYADSMSILNFDVDDTYVTVFGNLLMTVVLAYFGSRGAEKIMKK